MPDLLRKPFGTRGKVHQITPESAGWRYVGFSLYRLKAGDTAAEATGDREVILVIVEGKAAIRTRCHEVMANADPCAGTDRLELADGCRDFDARPPIAQEFAGVV